MPTAAKSDPRSKQKKTPPQPKKQAVVIVHGMGEQTPLETLRSFVRTIWEKDPNLTDERGDNQVWIKPDSRAGLQELGRITTRALKLKDGDQPRRGRRTDFYELYWADIMQGTTWQHLVSWVQGLLFRAPTNVPSDVRVIWGVMWVVTLMIAFAALMSLAPLETLEMRACGKIDPGYPCHITKYFSEASAVFDHPGFDYFARLLFWGMVAILILYMISNRRFGGANLSISILIAIFIFLFMFAFLEIVLILDDYLLLFTLGSALLLNNFVIPYFGDVARYVQARPTNVAQRKLVSERGLDLLLSLHKSGDYDRIIIVAHSLGTIVAYDLLTLLWSRIGPRKDAPPSSGALQEITDLDQWLQTLASSSEDWSIDAYQDRQRAIGRELARSHPVGADEQEGATTEKFPWLISDFVTLGSPLTHAEFLMERTREIFDARVRERRLPVSPPLLEFDDDRGKASFLYDSGEGGLVPHHAAVFSVVRWTNIYDQHHPWFFLLGDCISGPLRQNFGRGLGTVPGGQAMAGEGDGTVADRVEWNEKITGIREWNVRIEKWRLGFIPRLFTHTSYWAWNDRWSCTAPPEHIVRLRQAVNLIDE